MHRRFLVTQSMYGSTSFQPPTSFSEMVFLTGEELHTPLQLLPVFRLLVLLSSRLHPLFLYVDMEMFSKAGPWFLSTTDTCFHLCMQILHLAEAHPSLPGGMSEEGSKRLLNLQIAPASQGASQGGSQASILRCIFCMLRALGLTLYFNTKMLYTSSGAMGCTCVVSI
jgi:hypothetical protein